MGFLRFLSSLRTLAKNGDITIRDAYKFAQQEFGEVSDLLKLQINKIFKDADAPSIRKPEGKVIEASFKPGRDKTGKVVEESESQRLGLAGLKNPYRIGGGLDPVEGMTRTAARVVLDRKGIKVPEKGDPINVFEENFGGDALMDLKEAGEELLEKETTGRITESMGEFLESKGLFDLKVDKTLPKGMTNEELLKKLMDEDPEEFAKGGRVGYQDGGPTKDEYGIMSLPSVPSNPNSVNDDIDRVAQLVAQSYKMGPEEQMNNKQMAYDRIEEIAEQISYGGNIAGVRSNLIDYFNNKVQEYQSMIEEFSTGGRVGFQIGGPAYDATDPIYGSSAITVTPDTIMGPQGNQIQAQIGRPNLQRSQNPFQNLGFLNTQKHFDQNQLLKNAVSSGEITPEQYNELGGYDVTQTMAAGNPIMGGIGNLLGSTLYNVVQSVKSDQPFSDIPGDVYRNVKGGMGLISDDLKSKYESIINQQQSNVIPNFEKLSDGSYRDTRSGDIYGSETYGSIAAGMYPDIYNPNQQTTTPMAGYGTTYKWDSNTGKYNLIDSQARKGQGLGFMTAGEYGHPMYGKILGLNPDNTLSIIGDLGKANTLSKEDYEYYNPNNTYGDLFNFYNTGPGYASGGRVGYHGGGEISGDLAYDATNVDIYGSSAIGNNKNPGRPLIGEGIMENIPQNSINPIKPGAIRPFESGEMIQIAGQQPQQLTGNDLVNQIRMRMMQKDVKPEYWNAYAQDVIKTGGSPTKSMQEYQTEFGYQQPQKLLSNYSNNIKAGLSPLAATMYAEGGRVGYAYGSGLKLAQLLQKAGKSLKQAIKEAVDNINPTGDKKLDADMAVDDMLETYSIDRDAVDGYDILNAYDEAYKTIANPKTMSEVETLEAMGANITAKTLELVEKYPGLNSDLARKIASDPDPQRQAEVISTIEQAFELMKQGKSSDEVLDIMNQMTDRTKQAGGGLSYLSGF